VEGVDSGGSAEVAEFAVAGGCGEEANGHDESVTGVADFGPDSVGWGAGLMEGHRTFDNDIPACIRLFCLENISFEEVCLGCFPLSPYRGCGEGMWMDHSHGSRSGRRPAFQSRGESWTIIRLHFEGRAERWK
jgi:hypothetical protein